MTLEEAIRELKCSVLFNEREADKYARHGGTWYEAKAKAHKVLAEEHRQFAAWFKELKSYRETNGTADRPQGERVKSKTPKEFRDRMEELSHLDTERRHIEMDDCMCDLLTELGYGEGVEIFNSVTLWYS